MVAVGLLPGCDVTPFTTEPMKSSTPVERCTSTSPPSDSMMAPAWIAAMHTDEFREYSLRIASPYTIYVPLVRVRQLAGHLSNLAVLVKSPGVDRTNPSPVALYITSASIIQVDWSDPASSGTKF